MLQPIRDLKALKTLSTGKTQLGPRKSKSKMPSVGAQFNVSTIDSHLVVIVTLI